VLDHLMTSKPPGSFIVSTFVFVGFLYKIGIVTLATAGVCQYKPKLSFLYLGILILGWILFRHVPPLILNSTDPAELNALAMASATAGGSFIMGDSFSNFSTSTRWYGRLERFAMVPTLGKFLYSIPLMVFGIQHLIYTAFLAQLVPSWIPGSSFWVCATGLALVAAAISITFKWKDHWSTVLTGSVITLWIFVLHIPNLVANPKDEYEWTNLFQAIAIGVTAFVLNENIRRKPATPSTSTAKQKQPDRVITKTKKRFHPRRPLLKDLES
jgi:hypothetical protein